MTGLHKSQTEDATLHNQNDLPTIEDATAAPEEELRQYHKKLRQYFLTEKKTTDHFQGEMKPAWFKLASQQREPRLEFPIIFDLDQAKITSLKDALQLLIQDIFEADVADTLMNKVDHINSQVQEKLANEGPLIPYELQVEKVFNALGQFSESENSNEDFNKGCVKIKNHLLDRNSILLAYAAWTPFQLLNLQLQNRTEHNYAFLITLKKCISGLHEILQLHSNDAKTPEADYGFADSLVSLDKVKDMAPPVLSSNLSEERLNRLRNCLDTLNQAHKTYSSQMNSIFVSENLANEFELKKLFHEASLQIVKTSPITEARGYHEEEVKNFVATIGAVKLAQLEISQDFDEDLHGPYFEDFNRTYLSVDDIQKFRPLIVVEESRHLMQKPDDLLALLSEGAFVNILGINRLDDLLNINLHTDQEENYLELAALVIFRRNTSVFQGGTNTPEWLNKSFHQGLDSSHPTLWNILTTTSKKYKSCTTINQAVIQSRFFPRILYDIRSGNGFGNHFNLSDNPQEDHSFSSFDLKVNFKSGIQTHQLSLTMADLLILDPENLKKLEIIPSKYQNEDLIPLADYLTAEENSISGKIPFIWIVDDQNLLKQAAVPVTWVRRCRARLDYWHFLQEMGGVQSDRMQLVIDQAKSQWETAKEVEVKVLKEQLQSEFDHNRAKDLDNAIRRILNALIDKDLDIATILEQASEVSVSTQKEEDLVPAPEIAIPEKEEKSTISSEAWVESDECTSCNDCTDALPAVFKYNSDKLAYVHNPKGGSYAKIVATAEKCPARCIHPGLPHNPDEPGLDKLTQRAEKYN